MDRRPLSPDMWKSAFRENLDYYRRTGTLVANYWRDVASVIANAAAPHAIRIQGFGKRPPTTSERIAQETSALLLEGRAGDTALCLFVVENHMSEPTEAAVQSSIFSDTQGGSLPIDIRFDPQDFTLQPGAGVLVRASAVVPDEAVPGAAYDGRFSVPGLPGGPIRVRLRRLHDDLVP